MFTTAALACTTGAASAVVVRAATPAAVSTTTAPWYRPIAGFGFWMNHKHPSRRPPSPTS